MATALSASMNSFHTSCFLPRTCMVLTLRALMRSSIPHELRYRLVLPG